jgi:hypothetical protein
MFGLLQLIKRRGTAALATRGNQADVKKIKVAAGNFPQNGIDFDAFY